MSQGPGERGSQPPATATDSDPEALEFKVGLVAAGVTVLLIVGLWWAAISKPDFSGRGGKKPATSSARPGGGAVGATGQPPRRETRGPGRAESSPDKLYVKRVRSVPADDPDAAVWDQTSPFRVALAPQMMAMPSAAETVIPEIEVEAVSDGERIAFRLSWKDSSPDWNVDTGRFCDGVALGFPLDPGAPPTMGAKGMRMQILYWKALWQKDVDEGFQDVQDLHPNYWSDLYWFAEGKFPYPVSSSFGRPESRQWFPAHQAGNPMAQFEREHPVQELVAEGWGSLTNQQASITTGKGDWNDGRWSVVFSRPLTSEDPLDFQFSAQNAQFALAAWDGAAGQRGARKQWSSWAPLELEEHTEARTPRLVAQRVAKLPGDDPEADAWAEVPSVGVALIPQQMAMPQLTTPTVNLVRVQALHDGDRVSFRLSWRDDSADWNVDTGRFCDAVAVGFPLDPGAPPMMGATGLRMQILYWKALWQRDVDEGFQDVQDLHPNYWSDLYWFAEGQFPYRVPEAFQSEVSRQWFPAERAGNPMVRFERKQPVQELLAEGWGSLTHQEQSASTGRGSYTDGRWTVIVTRPLRTDDSLDLQLEPGQQSQAAFAVWNGADANRGGRKHWSTWVDFEVSR